MKLFNLAAAVVLGLGIPLLTQVITPTIAVARIDRPDGNFEDKDWNVGLSYQNNSYRYRGLNLKSQTSLELSGATISSTNQRKTYTWNNGSTRYQVVWQAQDPDYIRVQVIESNGNVMLNRLLSRAYPEGCGH
jgi:hypothetical protein